MPAPDTSQVSELPEPHACLVLWRVSVEAHLASLPRKKGERFLRTMAAKLAEEESLAEVFFIRPSSEREAVRRARRSAADIFSRFLPVFLARLPED